MDILNMPNWEVTSVSEEGSHYFIHAKYTAAAPGCVSCSSLPFFLNDYGTRKRILKDSPIRGKKVSIVLAVQRYQCQACGKVFVPKIAEVSPTFQLTDRLVRYVERETVKKSFLSVAQETGVNENTVREIFTQLIERNSSGMAAVAPRIMGIDEVYIGKEARCVLTDLENKRVIDILPTRRQITLLRSLIQLRDKEKIEAVSMDMWHPFRRIVEKMNPDARIVIDKYHVQRMCNQAIRIFLRKVKASFSKSECQDYLRDPYLLLNRKYTLKKKRKTALADWCSQFPDVQKMSDLKEEFFNIWRYSSRQRAEMAFDIWKEKIPRTTLKILLRLV